MKIVTHTANVANQADADAFFAVLHKAPRKGLTLSHVAFTVVPAAPGKGKRGVPRPKVAFYYSGGWSGISFWW